MNQISIFENKNIYSTPFKIKELNLKNFRRIHGKYNFAFGPGVNFITPNHDIEDEYIEERNTGIDFNPLDAHRDYFLLDDFTELIKILKANSYDLWDYSFFADDEYLSINLVTDEGDISNYYEKKKRYRGVEQLRIDKNFNNNKKSSFSRLKDKELNVFNDKMNSIRIFPDEYPILLKFQVTNSFDYLLDEFPTLSIDILVNDFIELCNKYKISYKFTYKDTCLDKNYYKGDNDYLLKLIMLVAIEKQLIL